MKWEARWAGPAGWGEKRQNKIQGGLVKTGEDVPEKGGVHNMQGLWKWRKEGGKGAEKVIGWGDRERVRKTRTQ